MEEVINKIVEVNSTLLGTNPRMEKINVGFTNTLYSIDDQYIVKICSDINNEDDFKKEIEFYNSNKNNKLIPKLYFASTDKRDVPYLYEIMEKIDGVSLYNVWHTFSDEKRKDVIRQLCEAMKEFHSNKGEAYDWAQMMKDKFSSLYSKAKKKDMISEDEVKVIDQAYSCFDKYLKSSLFVLVHNDLHFDNIFINDGKIKIIDFERSMYAPTDFELDILYRMIRKPWKFASEETEPYTSLEQYSNIMPYIEKYYPELVHIDNLYKRLAIYDMVYFLEQYIDYPKHDELKEDVLAAAKIVIEYYLIVLMGGDE